MEADSALNGLTDATSQLPAAEDFGCHPLQGIAMDVRIRVGDLEEIRTASVSVGGDLELLRCDSHDGEERHGKVDDGASEHCEVGSG